MSKDRISRSAGSPRAVIVEQKPSSLVLALIVIVCGLLAAAPVAFGLDRAPPGAGAAPGLARDGGAPAARAGSVGASAVADRFDSGGRSSEPGCSNCEAPNVKRVRKRETDCDQPRIRPAHTDSPSASTATRCDRGSSD